MRFQSFLLIFFISLLVASCIDDKKVHFTEINITTSENKIVEINIPQASGDKGISKKINNSLKSSIIEYLKLGDNEINKASTIEASIENFNSEYNKFKSDFPESSIEWDAQIDGEVMYHSEVVISVALTSYQNTGGAHGLLNISFLNFDVETGELITNEDLFSDFSAFKTIAEQHFNNEIAEKKDQYFEPDTFTLPENIGFDDEGLFLLYNTYEIAPYSTGLTEIHIPFTEVSMLLNYM